MGRAQAFALVRGLSGIAPPKVWKFPHDETYCACMCPAWRGGGTKFRPWARSWKEPGAPRASRSGEVLRRPTPPVVTRPW